MYPETCFVKVGNIAEGASCQEIVTLFNDLIGEVRKCERRFYGGPGNHLELAFNTPDVAKKALCMSGYNVAGVPLLVTAIPASRGPPPPQKPNLRRNLYVLGLPFDLVKSEFISIFSRFGKVSHCVILATVDNASRRRGFVVMSTHEEAKLAMDGLSGTDIKEHTIDVSWAVVQRSRGFLDGGDRAVLLDSHESSGIVCSDSGSTTPDSVTTTSGNSSGLCTSSINLLPLTSAKLLVMNLPTLLFSDSSDLNPLLRPFGSIQTMRILNSNADSAVISVVVEYRSFPEAQEAKAHLHGQTYAGFSLEVDHVHSDMLEDSQVGWWRSPCARTSLASSGLRKRISPLNPFAAPFVAGSQNDLSLPILNPSSNFNPSYTYPTSERKPSCDALSTEFVANVHAQNQGCYQNQQQRTQILACAIPLQPFSYHNASYVKTSPKDHLYPGFMPFSSSSGWSAQSHHLNSYPSVDHPYSGVYA